MNTTRYTATVRHHSIARARVVEVGDNLAAAKRNATREFGHEFGDYIITILDREAQNFDSEIAATRKVSSSKWADH